MASDSTFGLTTRTSVMRASHVPGDNEQLTAEMSAKLCAELEGRVPPGLVTEIVRSVLDESRDSTEEHAAEFTMLEARLRLERFIRARGSR